MIKHKADSESTAVGQEEGLESFCDVVIGINLMTFKDLGAFFAINYGLTS